MDSKPSKGSRPSIEPVTEAGFQRPAGRPRKPRLVADAQTFADRPSSKLKEASGGNVLAY